MAWDGAESSETGLTESSPGGGAYTSWYVLNPEETAECMVVRTDSSPTDRWLVEVFYSTDGSRAADVSRERYMLEANQLTFDFVAKQGKNFRVRCRAIDVTPTDTLAFNFYHVKNGVNLA